MTAAQHRLAADGGWCDAKPPRLKRHVIRTENEDIGSVGIGAVCHGAAFIVAPPLSDGSRGFQQPDTFGRADLRRGDKQTHPRLAAANVAVAWAGRRVDRGGWPRSGSAAPSAPRSRHRAPLAGRGPVIGGSSISFEARAGSHITPRLGHRVGSHRHRGRRVCHRRAALRVCSTRRARAPVLSGAAHSGGRITPGCT